MLYGLIKQFGLSESVIRIAFYLVCDMCATDMYSVARGILVEDSEGQRCIFSDLRLVKRHDPIRLVDQGGSGFIWLIKTNI